MIVFKITYFSKYHLQQSTENIAVPVSQLIGATQDDIIKLLDSKRKYNSLDCVYTCIQNYEDYITFIPTLRKIESKTYKNSFFDA